MAFELRKRKTKIPSLAIPGSRPDPISVWVHKNPVHIWEDDWGDLGDLGVGQVPGKLFQNTDSSLNSEFVACKKGVTKVNLTSRVFLDNHAGGRADKGAWVVF